MKTIEQYFGALNLAQVAAGMNHCRHNARRLLRSANGMWKDIVIKKERGGEGK